MADYSGVATAGALDQARVGTTGNSTAPDSGPPGAIGAGELVIGGITGGSPSAVTPGSSQCQAFTIRSHTNSGSADLEDALLSAAGTQDARATSAAATDWYTVVATFRARVLSASRKG